MIPDSETRPFALTSVKSRGSRRGTAAALVTPYALDETSTPSAAANTSADPLLTDEASTQQRNARNAMVAPIAQRRPCANRSRNGPISGATIANGSIVSPRNSATWSRASPEGTWKNRLPASEIATAASPAVLKTCSWISRCRPDSPAPSASDARRAWTTVNLLARAVPRPTERSPRAVAGAGGQAPAHLARPVAGRHRRGRDRDLLVRVPPALLVLGHAPILPRAAPRPDTTPADRSCLRRDHPRDRRSAPRQGRRRAGRCRRRRPGRRCSRTSTRPTSATTSARSPRASGW